MPGKYISDPNFPDPDFLFPIRRRAGLALPAIERHAERALASLGRGNPRPVRPRRRMANVLEMSARELGNPVALVVPVITDDRPLHGRISCRRSPIAARVRGSMS